MKKVIIPILLIIWCSIIGTRLIKADREESLHFSTDFFIKNAIHQYEDCQTISEKHKTFIDYDLLWAELDENWYFEFYVLWNWQWFYIDKRWNLNNNCSFFWIPITITLAENENWYYIYKYQKANKSDIQSVKKIFSENAFNNRNVRKNRKNNKWINFLNEAEQYFWTKLDENNEFECTFCDTKRYHYESTENKIWEKMELFGKEELWDKYIVFSSDGTLLKVWTYDEWTYTRHFAKNDSTIIINNKNNDSIIERFIINEMTDDELIAFSEYIQI